MEIQISLINNVGNEAAMIEHKAADGTLKHSVTISVDPAIADHSATLLSDVQLNDSITIA